MTRNTFTVERIIPAPAEALYGLLADYRTGHPSILPPAFSDFVVLEGGTGPGTRIRFTLTLAGRTRIMEATISEPEPGRVLDETYTDGSMTSFIIDPIDEIHSRLRIASTWPARGRISGLVERVVAPWLLGPLYRGELDLIESWAEEHTPAT